MKKILILGAQGMLGHDLQKVFPIALCWDIKDIDITHEEEVYRNFRKADPDLVINAAAYTDVEGCEDHRDLCFNVNGNAPGYIAESCLEISASLIHYSTDYVFDGLKKEYIESDTPHPINVYGESKLLGEKKVQETMEDYRIIRTSWLFGKYGKNFIETMLRLSKELPQVKVVSDQYGKPTYTVDLANKTKEISESLPGIYHVTNEGVCSWYEFARAIIPNVVACKTSEYPTKAKRPANSTLVNTKTPLMRHWNEALEVYLQQRSNL